MNASRPRGLSLEELDGRYAVCRLPADSPIPRWVTSDPTGHFSSITRTAEELSLVCATTAVPADARAERDWACFRVAGTLDFSEVGILARLARPLVDAEVSIFVVSTFDTDYLMVRRAARRRAVEAWTAAGHTVREREETR